MVVPGGFEPPANALSRHCSTAELRDVYSNLLRIQPLRFPTLNSLRPDKIGLNHPFFNTNMAWEKAA